MKRRDTKPFNKLGGRRGLSRITFALIIISIIVLLIIASWIIYHAVKKASEDTTDLANSPNLEVIESCLEGDNLSVVVQRNSKKGNLIGINFNISDGENFTIIRLNTTMKKKDNETFIFNLKELNFTNFSSVSIAPICLVETEDGGFIEVVGGFTSSTSVSSTDGKKTGGSGHGFICGNGVIEGFETCDDGNTVSGDGCSATCTIEVAASLNGLPSSLILTIVSDTEIQLNWTSSSTNEDGFSIERSTDNITYSEINTTAKGVVTYSDTGLTDDTTYYYRVRSFKGSKYSAYLNVNSNLPTFNRGKVVFTFDNHGAQTTYTYGHPLFLEKGITVTVYFQTDEVETGVWDYQKIQVAAGTVDLEDHSYTHSYFDELTEEQIITELENVNANFSSQGLPIPEHFAYPGGAWDFAAKPVIATLRKTARACDCPPFYPTYRNYDLFSIRSVSIDSIGSESYIYGGTDGMNVIKGYIDEAAANKAAIIFYAHYIVHNDPGLMHLEVDDLEELIDYAQSIDVDIITIPQLYDLMLRGNSVSSETDDFTLTATGNGSGVSALRLTTLQDITISLDGTAKFYSDAAGTLNESSTWEMKMGYRTIYIRCPSGTANLKIPKNEIVNFNGWASATNAASLGGDISQMKLLTSFYIVGSNTISGDISGLTGLTYIYIRGDNTISGDISGLTGLTSIRVEGSNTLSGDISGLTKLKYLRVWGDNTLSGSIEGLTLMAYLYAIGTNTLEFPNVTDLTDLCFLYVHDTVTLTSANVNQILADFWANRDAAKSRSERSIDIRGEFYSGAPTGQGITDKTNLQLYSSPTPPGTASNWTVATH